MKKSKYIDFGVENNDKDLDQLISIYIYVKRFCKRLNSKLV